MLRFTIKIHMSRNSEKMRVELELPLMFFTFQLRSWHTNSALITSTAFVSSRIDRTEKEAHILLCKPPVIMGFYQKQRKVISMISFRSTTESQSLWEWKVFHSVGGFLHRKLSKTLLWCFYSQIHMISSQKKNMIQPDLQGSWWYVCTTTGL